MTQHLCIQPEPFLQVQTPTSNCSLCIFVWMAVVISKHVQRWTYSLPSPKSVPLAAFPVLVKSSSILSGIPFSRDSSCFSSYACFSLGSLVGANVKTHPLSGHFPLTIFYNSDPSQIAFPLGLCVLLALPPAQTPPLRTASGWAISWILPLLLSKRYCSFLSRPVNLAHCHLPDLTTCIFSLLPTFLQPQLVWFYFLGGNNVLA